MVDEDCEVCQMLAIDFIDTPMFWGLDDSNMEYDRFEFSFEKSREDWEAEQHRHEEFNRDFALGKYDNHGFPNNEEPIWGIAEITRKIGTLV